MRNRNVIEAEISKLQAELADVKEYECARDSAVHILKNLGWTRSRGQWVKPAKANTKLFDKDTMTHIKAGDWVNVDTGAIARYGYVRRLIGKIAQVSYITGVTTRGAIVEDSAHPFHTNFLTVVSYEEIVKSR